MNKQQFLTELDSALQKVPSNERQDILQDFREHFIIGLDEGKTEEQISASLGSPHQIAKEMVASYHVDKMETTATPGNILRAVWAVIGLGFFNLIIILGPFITVTAVVISGWIVGIVFIASPLLVFIQMIIYPGTFAYFDLFVSITLCGLGLFIAIGMYYVTKLCIKGLIHYVKFNIKLVQGGLKHA